MAPKSRPSGAYCTVDQNTIRVVASLSRHGSAGAVLLELLRNKYPVERYNRPWPTQTRMAQNMNIERRIFCKALALLQKLGYVSVERPADAGRNELSYKIMIPMLELPDQQEFDEVSQELDAELAETPVIEPAPVKKIAVSHKETMKALWEKFCDVFPAELNPSSGRANFFKLSALSAALAVKRAAVYTNVYRRANAEQARYFWGGKSWLEQHVDVKDDAKLLLAWTNKAGIAAGSYLSTEQGLQHDQLISDRLKQRQAKREANEKILKVWRAKQSAGEDVPPFPKIPYPEMYLEQEAGNRFWNLPLKAQEAIRVQKQAELEKDFAERARAAAEKARIDAERDAEELARFEAEEAERIARENNAEPGHFAEAG